MSTFDAVLIVSFGGPEGREDVIPFLENVLRGRNVPRERMLEVAEHYYHFEGRSPINAQNRTLVQALQQRLEIPVFLGNRNWHPLLADTLAHMRDKGVTRALALATSAFGSYSGCRQYLENIENARSLITNAPQIIKFRPFSKRPLFLQAAADRLRDALVQIPHARVLFSAHSIPSTMSAASPYESELLAASAAVVQLANHTGDWKLVYQSRSGPPSQPWLGPDICDELRASRFDTVIMPIGFLSDHMEVLYDLDTEARAVAGQLGIRMVRAGTVGTHPAFIDMICGMVAEYSEKYSDGNAPQCEPGCCTMPQQRPRL